jgi:hypothetical protein
MKKVKVFDNERGFIKFVFITLVLVFLIYSGIQFGMPFYRYSAFKSDAKEIARISLGNVNRAKEDIFDRAKELNVPLEEDNLIVTRGENTVHVKASWSETVDILGLYQKQLDFTVNVEE